MKNFLVFFITICLFRSLPGLGQPLAFPSVQNEGNGLMAEYFNGTDFQEKVYTRIDEEISFFSRTASPAPGVHPEYYSIRWTGSLYAPVTGTYKITVRVDDGVRLWVNDLKILDQWMLQRATTYSRQLELTEGEFYRIKIEYFNGPTYAVMQLMWETPVNNAINPFGLRSEASPEIIPKKYLYGHMPEKEQIAAIPAEEQVAPALVVREKKNNSPASVDEKETGPQLREAGLALSVENEEIFENLRPGEVVTFKHVLFEQGKYILLESSYAELDKLLKTMLRYPALRIRIDGHTDNIGDPNLNQSLSFFRAKVVETYLVEKGVDVSRIEVNGYGSSRPLADNATEEGRAKNRRVEFVVQ